VRLRLVGAFFSPTTVVGSTYRVVERGDATATVVVPDPVGPSVTVTLSARCAVVVNGVALETAAVPLEVTLPCASQPRLRATPMPTTDAKALATVEDLIALLGASAVTMSAQDHDAAVAKISHLPQIISSVLAGQLLGTKPEWMELAGQGLRDTTRIAGSDEKLWKEIIHSNRQILSGLLKILNEDVIRMLQSLEDPSEIEKILAKGRSGREFIPGKHGGKAREYSYLPIVIDDKPGQLAAIFNQCSLLDVNVEDLTIEHSPGQLSALITLALSAQDAHKLSDHLASIGWNVHPIRN
jgi:prephenate dehydrogenase